MPFKIILGGDGYWVPPRPNTQHEDIAMEEGPKSPGVAGRFRVNQPWLDNEWGKTAAWVPVGEKRRRISGSQDPIDPAREMMAAMRKPGAGQPPGSLPKSFPSGKPLFQMIWRVLPQRSRGKPSSSPTPRRWTCARGYAAVRRRPTTLLRRMSALSTGRGGGVAQSAFRWA